MGTYPGIMHVPSSSRWEGGAKKPNFAKCHFGIIPKRVIVASISFALVGIDVEDQELVADVDVEDQELDNVKNFRQGVDWAWHDPSENLKNVNNDSYKQF